MIRHQLLNETRTQTLNISLCTKYLLNLNHGREKCPDVRTLQRNGRRGLLSAQPIEMAAASLAGEEKRPDGAPVRKGNSTRSPIS